MRGNRTYTKTTVRDIFYQNAFGWMTGVMPINVYTETPVCFTEDIDDSFLFERLIRCEKIKEKLDGN